MKRYILSIIAVAAVFLTSFGSAYALSTYQTVQGGTGTSSPSGILYGDNGATSHLNTVTVGSGLSFSGGTLSASGGSGGTATTSFAATWPITLTTSASAITYGFNGLSTSSPAVVSNIPYFSGVNTFANVATSSASNGTGISLSGTAALVGTGGLTITNTGVISVSCTTITCSGTNPASFSIGSNAISNSQLVNSTISGVALGSNLNSLSHDSTLSGTSYNGSAAVSDWGLNLSHANTWTALQQFGNATSTLFSASYASATTAYIGSLNVGTLSGFLKATAGAVSTALVNLTSDVTGVLPLGNGGTGATSLGSGLTNSGSVLAQVEHRSFTYATSTAWTGTTTMPLETGYGEIWNSVRCFTDAGTLGVDFYHGTSHLNYIPTASTTQNINTFSTNNTVTAGDKVYVDIGTPVSSPTKLTCTVLDTY